LAKEDETVVAIVDLHLCVIAWKPSCMLCSILDKSEHMRHIFLSIYHTAIALSKNQEPVAACICLESGYTEVGNFPIRILISVGNSIYAACPKFNEILQVV
jgi:hypothetical protein